MRKVLMAGAVSIALALGGCATTGSGSGSVSIKDVQSAAVAACGFLPTVTTVANLISMASSSIGGILTSASGIASSICSAVTPSKMSGKLRGVPMVNGVQVRGRFVN